VDPFGIGADEKRETFFRLVFGKGKGLVCLAFMTTNKKGFREEFFRWPEELPQILTSVAENVLNNNVYFCPQLFRERKRSKEYVECTPNAWADLDFCEPDNMLIAPTCTVESSPGRYQAYWVMERENDPDDMEDLSRRIAYRHADEGADRSGWDLTQLLRVPETFNYKYTSNIEVPKVKILVANRNNYRLDDFTEYPESPQYKHTATPMPEPDVTVSAEDLLQSHRLTLNPIIWRLFSEEPPVKSWSEVLWNLLMLLFENDFTADEVFVIAKEAKCNKWARDGKPVQLLWKEVCRAEGRSELNHKLLLQKPEELIELMSDEERTQVEAAPDTFVERYIEWASGLGDAAPQYHQAGAFVCLSSLLAGSIRLPTSYGMIVPNIWFMILADTTLTRKTTSMDIAMELIEEVDSDIVMATDGSIEGLLTALSSRPNRPSVFLRDEFSGLLEQMTKKDYMAGMPELLAKLYDGKMQKRILRKEIIEVRDPRLIMFTGGIKTKIMSLLTYEHVNSGFMPRFVFITAESDLSRLRPIGPPTTTTTGNRSAILAELTDISKRYDQTQVITVEKLKTKIERKLVFDATMTPDAWVRYNKLEANLLEMGLKSDKPDILTPIGDRLAKSILKAALLMAAATQRGDEIIISELDILRAIKYGERWRVYAQEVIDNVGKGVAERLLDNIHRTVVRNPSGVSRSVIMQNHHLTARDATQIFETLEQRGLVKRQKVGRGEMLVSIKGSE
jgi:hypothetical protein